MASYEKREDGYSVRWRDPDGTNRRKQVPSLALARRLVAELEEAHALGRRWQPDAGGHSIEEIADAFLTDKRRVWRPKTYAVRDVALSLYEAWARTRYRRSRLGPEVWSRQHLADWWNHLVEERGCSPATANQYVGYFEQLWDWAWRDDTMSGGVPRPVRLDLPEIVRDETQAPTWAQMDAVIATAARPYWRKYLIVLRCTGLRPEQASRLVWTDFDLEAGVLRMRGELGKSKRERRGRRQAIAPVLVEELAGWGRREGAVHGHPDGPDWVPNFYTRRHLWDRTDAPAEVCRQPLHCFRKGWRTELRAAGADPDALDFMQGHRQPAERDTYTDPRALPLITAVGLVPPIGVQGVSRFQATHTRTPL